MEAKTVYFDNLGKENTNQVLHIAAVRAKELSIQTIVVSSVTGETAVKAMKVFEGLRVIAVTHVTGYDRPNTQEFLEENRKVVEAKGGKVLTVTPVFGGLSLAMQKKLKTYTLGGIVSSTLSLFGAGMKEACEITVTAADSGLVRTDEEIISIAGTDGGADTAIVLKPVHSLDFWDLRVGEILCKPRFL